LLRGASSREEWKNADSLSGSVLERVVIDGEPYVLKHLHVDDDWIQRAQGDIVTRPVIMWRTGLFDALPSNLDHTTVDVATGLRRNGWGAAVLMHDVGPAMVTVTDGFIPFEQHLRFLDHMAGMHAHFWGFEDTLGLMPMGNRFFMLTPAMSSYEIARGTTDPVPNMVSDGWERMTDESPDAARIVMPLVDNPFPLVDALERKPHTLVHGDWKAGNLGSHPDGRTVVLDWAFPGAAPCTLDLGWYIAVNCDLLPHSKEDAIDAYHDSLRSKGVDTSGWWESQLELALLTELALMGWSKTGDELAWWTDRAQRAKRYLDG
jgi:hypothetical protein